MPSAASVLVMMTIKLLTLTTATSLLLTSNIHAPKKEEKESRFISKYRSGLSEGSFLADYCKPIAHMLNVACQMIGRSANPPTNEGS